MPRLFITGIVLFLLLGAGYGILQAARAIPWDCSDWQAFAHSDRTTAILESLAENRGKTLYCGIDQSDTFTKAETWQAGKDRNERDDTVYWGERGSFRGFIAAQEGWLTNGESGITGQSTATIFEFPREKRRTKRVKRFRVGTDPDQFPITAAASCRQVLGLICSDWDAIPTNSATTTLAQQFARHFAVGRTNGDALGWTLDRETNIITDLNNEVTSSANPSRAQWQELLAAGAARSAGPGAPAMSPAAPSSAPATTTSKAPTGTIWAGSMGRILIRVGAKNTKPGKAAPGRLPARKPSAAIVRRQVSAGNFWGGVSAPQPSFRSPYRPSRASGNPEWQCHRPNVASRHFWIPPCPGRTVRGMQPLSHVIPSVAEESKNPEMESRSGIPDSSATLGMTWEGTAFPGYSPYPPPVHPSTLFRMNGWSNSGETGKIPPFTPLPSLKT